MANCELDRKRAFFRNLEDLTGNFMDEQRDEGMLASMTFLKDASKATQLTPHQQWPPNSPISVTGLDSLTNLSSEPDIDDAHSPPPIKETIVESAELIDVTSLTTTRVQKPTYTIPPRVDDPTVSGMEISADSKITRKRKRGNPIRQIPEHRRVFKGLRFYFVPNNDIAPTRRMRIHKAMEYGAEWVTEWKSSPVSHIIVDKSLTYADVLKYLKLEDLPSGIIIVNEDYTAECISSDSLVPCTLRSYQVKGYQQAKAVEKKPLDTTAVPVQPKLMKMLSPGQKFCTPPTAKAKFPENRPALKERPGSFSNVPLEMSQDTRNQSIRALKLDSDPFQEAVASAKATAHLPLDSDDDDESRQNTKDSTPDSSGGERGSHERQSKATKRASSGDKSNWQSKFQCMQDHNSKEDKKNNPNILTINILQEMEDYYYSIRDTWRIRAYRQAIATLRKQSKRIMTKEEAESLPFIGARLAAKIEEIVWTNKLQRLENAKLEPNDQALQLFLHVYGAGFTQASKWVQEGHKTLEDLLSKAKLTPNQRIGVEHYEEFRTRIPRPESAQLGSIVTTALHQIDADFEAIIGGSYRRGAKDSGDLDMLITKKDASPSYLRTVVLETLVPQLQKQGFLVAALAVTDRVDGSKWHGACQLPISTDPDHVNDPKTNPNPWRRIDLLLVPYSELGAAKIYFTGNDIFNRSMRLLARRKGMRLNQRGLYKDVLREGSVRLTEGTKIEGESEVGIFKVLGVPWREAWERDI